MGDPELSLEQVDALRRRILNVVGHELRTPITALTGLARRLGDASELQIRTEIGPALVRLAERTEALLDDMLIASGISTATPPEGIRRARVSDTVGLAWSSLAEQTVGRVLRFDTNHDEPEVAAGDESVLRCLTHLFRNALAYGTGPIEVTITADDEVVRCAVRNEAVGPKPDEEGLIFEPFFRGEHAVTRSPGMGVGLTVARTVARAVGGDVTMRRDDEQQVVFELSLPRA